jgi:hypothetical protein
MNLAGGCLLLFLLWLGAGVLVAAWFHHAKGGHDDED